MVLLKKIKIRLLLLAVIPLVLMGFLNGYFGTVFLARALRSECMNKLRTFCVTIETTFENMNDEPYTLNENGDLVKGDFNLSANKDKIKKYVENNEFDLAIIYGNENKLNTDEVTSKDLKKVTDEVANYVLAGNEYSNNALEVGGERYYGFYLPLSNPDGKVVGMIFAGQSGAEFEKLILQRKYTLIGMSAVILVIASISVLFVAIHIAKAINNTEKGIRNLAEGNLKYRLDEKLLKRSDEIGDMARSTNKSLEFLGGLFGEVKNISEQVLESGDELENVAQQSNQNAIEISRAIDDIAKGAASQAEDVENATQNIDDMGKLITSIVNSIEVLNATSSDMQMSGEEADEYIKELDESNDKTVNAVRTVARNVEATDESVNKISEAVKLIQSVAEQTNLLSLNAAIEAARAGEAGKGFAVVASEIQKLSDESNKSAVLIAEIIDELLKDSKNSMEMMDEVKVKLREQQKNLDATKEKFGNVKAGLLSSREETKDIHIQAQDCDSARDSVTNVITNLSTLSEENAAAAEETRSSMEELDHTIGVLAQSAENLKNMAVTLEEKIQFFKI